MWPGSLLLPLLGYTFTVVVTTFGNIGASRKRSLLSFGDWESVTLGSCSPGGMGECGDFLEDDTFFVIVGTYGAELISAE